MKLLLDTHVFLWWVLDAPELSDAAKRLMINGENNLYWSAASSWEVAIKYQLGKLPLPHDPGHYIPKLLATNAIESIPITDEHSFTTGRLPFYHRDPFDRILVAQAMVEGLAILSKDAAFSHYAVKVIW